MGKELPFSCVACHFSTLHREPESGILALRVAITQGSLIDGLSVTSNRTPDRCGQYQ